VTSTCIAPHAHTLTHARTLSSSCSLCPQRFTEPTVTSDEYEQGAYVYFDYNIVHDDMQTGWCYRRKENFTFRYDALEDDLKTS
jgi:CCR4-NOT transcriptional regulation complex NOT5 subunit